MSTKKNQLRGLVPILRFTNAIYVFRIPVIYITHLPYPYVWYISQQRSSYLSPYHLIRFEYMYAPSVLLRIASSLRPGRASNHHAGGKHKFYVRLSLHCQSPITALSPSNKKNGIHRPVNSLAWFYPLPIAENSVGVRPDGSNLSGLSRYSLVPSRCCLLDVALPRPQVHAGTRADLSKAQTQANADTLYPDPLARILSSKLPLLLQTCASTIPGQPFILSNLLGSFVGTHSCSGCSLRRSICLGKSLSYTCTRHRSHIGGIITTCRFPQHILGLSLTTSAFVPTWNSTWVWRRDIDYAQLGFFLDQVGWHI